MRSEFVSKEVDQTRSRPTDEKVLELLRRSLAARGLAACFAAPEKGYPRGVVEGLGVLKGPESPLGVGLGSLLEAWESAEEKALSTEYSRLFFGATPCPPRETAYPAKRRLVSSVELADIQGFYRAFGFEPIERGRELPDHLSAQLEFHGILLLKLAYAVMQDRKEEAEVTEKALRSFLEDHLGRWTAAFAERLRSERAALPFLLAAEVCRDFLERECRLWKVDPDPLPAEKGRRLDETEPEVFACPQAARCGVADEDRGAKG